MSLRNIIFASSQFVVAPDSILDILGDNSCKALYRFESNTLDESGNYTGTATSLTYGDGTSGKFAIFNGSTSKMNFPTLLSTTTNNTDFSVVVKINFASLPNATYYQGIIGTSNSDTGAMSLIVRYVSAGVFSLDIRRSYGGTIYYLATGLPTVNLSINTDYYIGFSYTATTKSVGVYLNGALVATITLSSSAGATTIQNVQSLGQYNSNGSYNLYAFNGKGDQLRFFNKALNTTEHNLIYTQGA